MKGRWVIEALMVYVSWIVDGDAIRVDKADLRSRERQKISPSPQRQCANHHRRLYVANA